MNVDEARRRLCTVSVVRLATADREARPHLIPATFVLSGDVVHMVVDNKPKRSRDLKRLRNIEENPRVVVLADHYEDDWNQLWWVRADGLATIVDDPVDMAGPIRLLVERYPQYRRSVPDGPVISIHVDRWTCWSYAGD